MRRLHEHGHYAIFRCEGGASRPLVTAITAAMLLVSATVSGSLAANEVAGQLLQTGEEPREVELASIDLAGEWQVVGEGDSQPQSVSTSQVVRFGSLSPIRKGGVAVLHDGSLIVGSEFSAVGRSLNGISPDLWDEFTLPMRSLRGLLLRIPIQAEAVRKALDEIAAYDGQRDMVVFNNHDRVQGTFRRLTRDAVEIQIGDEIRTIQRNKIAEIRFAPTVATGTARQGRGWVGFRDGSLIRAAAFTSRGGRHRLVTTDGVELNSLPPINMARELVYIQPQHDQVRFLSDMEPLSYKHLGFLDVHWDYRMDRNVTGGPLQSGGRMVAKGIGLHSTARLAYRVPSEARRFKAKVGIDDSTMGRGSVIFRVFLADSSGQWSPIFESPIVRGGDDPLPVDIDLQDRGARGLALVVEFADQADVLDHANWLEARFEQ